MTAVELTAGGAALAELEAAHPGRLRVIEADALGIDVAALLPAPRKIIANLPYNVATPLLVGWLRGAAALEGMALMFQQEVAERICAAPDTDAYGRLAVLAQWRCRCSLLLRLPPGAFSPPPKVWSAVVGFVPHPEDPGEALFRGDGAADGGRLRPAPQDAARGAEVAGRCGGAAGGGRDRGAAAGGNPDGRRIRPYGPGAAGPSGLTRPPGMSPAFLPAVLPDHPSDSQCKGNISAY